MVIGTIALLAVIAVARPAASSGERSQAHGLPEQSPPTQHCHDVYGRDNHDTILRPTNTSRAGPFVQIALNPISEPLPPT